MLSSRKTISLEYLIRGFFVVEEGAMNVSEEKPNVAKFAALKVNSWPIWSKD